MGYGQQPMGGMPMQQQPMGYGQQPMGGMPMQQQPMGYGQPQQNYTQPGAYNQQYQ